VQLVDLSIRGKLSIFSGGTAEEAGSRSDRGYGTEEKSAETSASESNLDPLIEWKAAIGTGHIEWNRFHASGRVL